MLSLHIAPPLRNAMNLIDRIVQFHPAIRDIRRDIHAHPELRFQETRTADLIADRLQAWGIPIVRGLALTREDLLRRAVIMAIMCQGRVEFESIELAHLIKMRDYFAAELAALEPFVEGGLVEVNDESIQLTAMGWYFVRGVAMTFDKNLQADKVRERFSRII